MPLLQTDVAVKTPSIEAGKPTTIIVTLYPQLAPLSDTGEGKASSSLELIMGYVQLQGELIIDRAVIDPARFVAADTKKLGLASRALDRRSSGSRKLGINDDDHILLEEEPILFTTSTPHILCVYDEHLVKYNDETHQYYHADSSYYEDTLTKYGLFTTARQLLFVENSKAEPSSSSFASRSSFSQPPLAYADVNGVLGNQHRQFVVNIDNLPANLPPSYINTPSVKVKYNLIVGIHYRDSSGSAIRHSEGWFNVTLHNQGAGAYTSVFDLNVNTPRILRNVRVTERSFLSDFKNTQDTSSLDETIDTQTKYTFPTPLPDPKKSDRITQNQLQKQKEFLRFAKTLISGKGSARSKLQAFPTKAYSLSSSPSPLLSPSFPTVYSSTANGIDSTTGSSSNLKSKFDIMYKNNRKLCNILLSKPQYTIGDTIYVVVDCSNSVYKPFHITASLETEESILETDFVFLKTIERNSISTYSITKTKFEFSVPVTEPGQFRTNINELRWLLRFQFIVLVPDTEESSTAGNELEKVDGGRHDNDGVHLRIKENLPCDTFNCKIPLPISSRRP